MTRTESLEKRFPHFSFSLIDLFKMMDKTKTNKYLPVFCKILSEEFKKRCENFGYILDIKEGLKSEGISVDNLTTEEIVIVDIFKGIFPNESFDLLNDFIDYMERNLIDNKDILTYKDSNEIRNAVAMASIKENEKSLENECYKEFEDSTWLAVRPLTFNSSLKYGAGTKWCTTMKNEKSYFKKYTLGGAMIYIINKKTGYKFALNKIIDVYDRHNGEISLWNMVDDRVDFLNLDIDEYMYPVIKKIATTTIPNSTYLTPELRELLYKECSEKIREIYPVAEEEITVRETLEVVETMEVPIVRMGRDYNYDDNE
jgi:hypothetical protein